MYHILSILCTTISDNYGLYHIERLMCHTECGPKIQDVILFINYIGLNKLTTTRQL